LYAHCLGRRQSKKLVQTPVNSNLLQTWEAALCVLEETLGAAEVDGWLRGADLLALDSKAAKLSVPSTLHHERIRDRHLQHICYALAVEHCELEINELDIEQMLSPEELNTAAPPLPMASNDFGLQPQRESKVQSPECPTAEPLLLNDEYKFNNFVVGPCNRFAHAAAHGVADRPARAFNPLFLHGSVGLGKTHLMQSIAHRLRINNPAVRIAFLSCEEFINHFVSSIQQGSVTHFRERYRNVDVLVVDDIQMLANKERTQEEFFHTFNALHNANKQIVLSSDAPPGEIPALQERLISRFKWGLVAEIETPCFETRTAILRKKADRIGLELPDEIAHFIAEHVDSNVRELEGTLTHLHALAMLHNLPISLPLARQALGSERTSRLNRIVRMDDIIAVILTHFGVRLADLQSKSRTKSIVYPRQVAMHLARSMTDLSLEEIGGYFGGRDHSTAVYAIEKMEKRRRVSGDFNTLLADLERRVRNG
jgi:chromosomal replication initiator protein